MNFESLKKINILTIKYIFNFKQFNNNTFDLYDLQHLIKLYKK